MSLRMESDELRIGQLVTILNGPSRVVSSMVRDDGEVSIDNVAYDGTLEGMPLQIVAVNLPFVLTHVLSCNACKIIDTRTTDLCRIEADYARAFMQPMTTALPQPAAETKPADAYPWNKFFAKGNN